MSLTAIQFALFFRSPIESVTKIAMNIQGGAGEIFDAEATILPIPQDAPPEIPVAILQSKDGSKSANIAKGRIDIFFNSNNPLEGCNLDEASRLFEAVRGFVRAEDLARFGVTLTYFDIEDNPVAQISHEYLKENVDWDCTELMFRFNRPFIRQGNRYNRIEMIQNAVAENASRKHSGIVQSFDVNTDPSRASIVSEDIQVVLDEIYRINGGKRHDK